MMLMLLQTIELMLRRLNVYMPVPTQEYNALTLSHTNTLFSLSLSLSLSLLLLIPSVCLSLFSLYFCLIQSVLLKCY